MVAKMIQRPQANTPAGDNTVSARLASFVFGLFIFFLCTTIGLAGFIFLDRQLFHSDAELMSRKQLEAELVKGNSTDAIYPHADPRVGFVFNPAVKTASWGAPDEGPNYRVNRIGLRGREIEPKKPGVVRIVLVSDSWFWGWKLPDNERLEVQLKHLLDQHFHDNSYEVVTIAIPGWNVENEAAFIRDHIDVIQPDILVWSINPNDTWVTNGVLPPGILASKLSRSSDWICPETVNQTYMAPSFHVLQSWKDNVQLINKIEHTYNVPIVALFTNEFKTYVAMIKKVGAPDFPIFMTPLEYQNDKRWYVRYPTDFHPTSWATRLIAIDILGRLVKHHLIPDTAFDEQEHEIIAKGVAASEDVSPKDLETFLATGAAPYSSFTYPTSYSRGNGMVNNPGLVEDWYACPQGRLVINNPAGNRKLSINFDQIRNDLDRQNKLNCEAVMPEGHVLEGREDRVGEIRTCSVELPITSQPKLVDFIWRFDRFTCVSPYYCFAARFVSLKGEATYSDIDSTGRVSPEIWKTFGKSFYEIRGDRIFMRGPDYIFTEADCSAARCEARFSIDVQHADAANIVLYFLNDQGRIIAEKSQVVSGTIGISTIESVTPESTKKVRALVYSAREQDMVEFKRPSFLVDQAVMERDNSDPR
jgi:hypothetical protein